MRIESFFQRLLDYSIYAMVIFFAISKAILLIAFTTALVSWLFLKIKRRDGPNVSWDFLFVSLSVFVFFSVLSAFVSHYPMQSIHGVGKLLREILLCVMIADTFQSKDKIRRLISIGTVASLVVFLDAIYQFGMGKDLLRGQAFYYVDVLPRLLGPFKDHTIFASYLIAWVSIYLALICCLAELKPKEKTLLALLAILSAFCLFHTQARGAWLSFALAFLFFAVIQKQKILLAALGIAIVVGLVILPKNMIVHPDAERKEQSLIERSVLWDRAINVIKARPWLGTGINTYVRSYQQFDTTKSWRVQNYYAHNSYLQLAADRGLIALSSLLAFIGTFFWRSFSIVRGRFDLDMKALLKGLMTALVGLLALGLVDTVFEPLQTGMLIWLLFGMGLAAIHIATDRKEAEA